ncbi:MAG: hypothetical protein ACYDBI_05720 [Thermoplasmataceae archaeon]
MALSSIGQTIIEESMLEMIEIFGWSRGRFGFEYSQQIRVIGG